jgi:uncharacterized protein (TIGR02466 family)
MAERQQNTSTVTPSATGHVTKVAVMPLFSTWIYQCQDGPRDLSERLEELAHRLMQDQRNATVRTNQGGWHYAFDLFELDEPVIGEFRNQMEQHVQAFLNHFRAAGRKKKDQFRLRGWINVNRAGDSNRLHSHPGCFLSATYYVKVPPDMKGGEIFFRDPRGPAVAMYETRELIYRGSAQASAFPSRPPPANCCCSRRGWSIAWKASRAPVSGSRSPLTPPTHRTGVARTPGPGQGSWDDREEQPSAAMVNAASPSRSSSTHHQDQNSIVMYRAARRAIRSPIRRVPQ